MLIADPMSVRSESIPLSAPASLPLSPATQWEHTQFQFFFPKPTWWVRVDGITPYSIPQAQQFFWNQVQQQIHWQMRAWLDQGWQPVGEVGPSGISVRLVKRLTIPGAVLALYVVATAGFGLLFLPVMKSQVAEPIAFSVAMRRPRTALVRN